MHAVCVCGVHEGVNEFAHASNPPKANVYILPPSVYTMSTTISIQWNEDDMSAEELAALDTSVKVDEETRRKSLLENIKVYLDICRV